MTKVEREMRIKYLSSYRWIRVNSFRNTMLSETGADALSSKIEQMIDSMPSPRDRVILKMKFIDGMTHVQIADIINYSLTQTKKFFDEALSHLSMPTDNDLAILPKSSVDER